MGIRGAGAVALATLLSVATVATPSNAADPNTPPIAVDDPNPGCQVAAFGDMYPIPEDPKETAVLALACGPLANDTDADGDHLVPELVADAQHGTAAVRGAPARRPPPLAAAPPPAPAGPAAPPPSPPPAARLPPPKQRFQHGLGRPAGR